MRKKIKVVHLVPGISSGGGAENVIVQLCRAMDHSRFDPEVLYWREEDDLAEAIRQAGARATRIPVGRVISPSTVAAIIRTLKDRQADVLHTHFMDADLLGVVAGGLAHIPVITHIHSFPFPAVRRHGLRYHVMASGIKKIVCVSSHVREHVKRMTGLPEDKFAVIYNGIDLAPFRVSPEPEHRRNFRQSFGFGEGDTVIGNVSRLIPDKGHAFLIKAIPRILERFPDVKFLIVGDGPLRGELESLADSLGIAGKVVFAGKRDDIPQLLACMDIFVFPTFAEAFGLCVVEAMAAGLPVVATDDAAVPEIVRGHKEGLLVSPGDEKFLAQAVIDLLSDAAMARSLALAARKRAEDFSVETMAGSFEDLYAFVVG